MTCTNKPIQAVGVSRSSLLQKLGVGDVWAFLRDLIQNTMLRADFYDGEGNFYHGFANSIGVDGTVKGYTGDQVGYSSSPFGASPVVVNDYWQTDPQSEEMLQLPGTTSFVRSCPRYTIDAVGNDWTQQGTHKEVVHKISINGEIWYGRTPLFSQNPDSAVTLPNNAGSIASWADVKSAIVDLNNRLMDQGILRATPDNGGPI